VVAFLLSLQAVVVEQLAMVIALVFLLSIGSAFAGEKQLCQLAPGEIGEWHFRTRIPGPHSMHTKCFYQGERMKPRDELYWAEAPAIPMPKPKPVDGSFELRWKGHTE